MNDLDKAMEAEVLAQQLIRFAESLRARPIALWQGDEPALVQEPPRSGWREPSHVEIARTVYRARREREKYLPSELLGEPVWDILLDLYISQIERREINITSVSIASCVPSTTALRWIGLLEECGLIERNAAAHDKRVVIVRLTGDGMSRMQRYLRQVGGKDAGEAHPFLLRPK